MTRPAETEWAGLAEEYTGLASVGDPTEMPTTEVALVSLALSAREIVYELRGIREALEGIANGMDRP